MDFWSAHSFLGETCNTTCKVLLLITLAAGIALLSGMIVRLNERNK